MNYYIASDKFGNYDLKHYGVPGMKWGEHNAQDLTLLGAFGRVKKAIPQKSSPVKLQNHSSSPNSTKPNQSSPAKPEKNRYVPSESNSYEEVSESPKEIKDDFAEKEHKIVEDYQNALLNMQIIARTALSSGVSLGSSLEYLAARKEVLKAKYELDKMQLEKQEALAEDPPTYAEEKRSMDSQAKEKRAEEQKKTFNRNDARKRFYSGLGSK